MGSATLLEDVWSVLAADAEFLAFKGLDPTTADELAISEYIVNDEETNDLEQKVPICLLYERPGAIDRRTTQVYVSKVVLACYATTQIEAQKMADRAWELLKKWQPCGSAFSCQLAHRTSFATGLPGVKGFRSFFDFQTYVG